MFCIHLVLNNAREYSSGREDGSCGQLEQVHSTTAESWYFTVPYFHAHGWQISDRGM